MGGKGTDPPADLFKNLRQSPGDARRWGSAGGEEPGESAACGRRPAGDSLPEAFGEQGWGAAQGILWYGVCMRVKATDLAWPCL